MDKIIKCRDTDIVITDRISCCHLIPPDADTMFVVDSLFYELHRKEVADLATRGKMMHIIATEHNKNKRQVDKIHRWLLSNRADRNTYLIAVGGGVVSDIVGYAAATYMRGINFGIISTTLMGQVDAAIGGKNGVNFGKNKNLIGTFYQPKFVNCPTSVISTLSEKQFNSGMAEVIKYRALFPDMMRVDIVRSAKNRLSELIACSVMCKTEVVSKDMNDNNQRKHLNFGHTIGHALELSDPQFDTHGKAVGTGMYFALKISVLLRGSYVTLDMARKSEEIISLLNDYGLVIRPQMQPSQITKMMLSDKKKKKNQIDMVLLDEKGPYIASFSSSEIEAMINSIMSQM